MNTVLMTGAMLPMAGAPTLELSVTPTTAALLRGVALFIVVAVVGFVLIKKMNFMGGQRGSQGGKMQVSGIVVALLVAAILMDIDLFVTLVNLAISLVYELGQIIKGFLSDISNTGGGTVDTALDGTP
ncbi:MAG TPA: hypothetical protein VFC06_02125 [Demequina sp.]|nr:hypothetical protein [Demequina sp.]